MAETMDGSASGSNLGGSRKPHGQQRAKTLPPSYHGILISEDDLDPGDSTPRAIEGQSGYATETSSSETITNPGKRPFIEETCLGRHGTLLSSGATTIRRAAELKLLLGNANSRLRSGTLLSQPSQGREPTSFEQAKPRARVEIDIALYSNICVEGENVKGLVKIRIRPRLAKEAAVSISDGKLRLVGFESTDGNHHEFFQHSAVLSTVVKSSLQKVYNSPPDSEGFCVAREGVHKLEFDMHLPIRGSSRPKGPFYGESGFVVRYIALVSIQVKDESGKRSIAHFYRDCEVWPRLNPSVILAPAHQPLRASTSKSLFMGGNGEVRLTAFLPRSYFVSGTQVSVHVIVQNETKKLIKSLTLTLHRSTVIFKRKLPDALESTVDIVADPKTCQITSRKTVATSTLVMAQGFPRGHASTRGWWAGVPSGERSEFSHFVLIPPDALTHTQERLIEVTYAIRVSLNTGSLTSDVSVTLPIHIVNLISLDPPQSGPLIQTPAEVPVDRNAVTRNLELSCQLDDEPLPGRESDFSDPDSNDNEIQESCTEEDLENPADLGNLFMDEDADLVLHAILSAQIHDRTENAVQYPASIEARHDEGYEEVDNREASNSGQADSADTLSPRPSQPRGPSSFSQRVQRKLQAARQPLVPDSPRLNGVREETSSAILETLPDHETDSCLHVPSTGYKIASSSFLNDRYCSRNSESTNERPTGSRLLPRPPLIVGLPFSEIAPNYSEVACSPTHVPSVVEDDQSVDTNISGVGHSPNKLKRPSIAPLSSATSVKEKIKELEDRARAAEGY